MENKDQELRVEVVSGLLTISIGVTALCAALQAGPAFETGGEGEASVTDEDVFVRAIVGELKSEDDEVGTPVHRLFDAAALDAIDAGCEGVRFPGDA